MVRSDGGLTLDLVKLLENDTLGAVLELLKYSGRAFGIAGG